MTQNKKVACKVESKIIKTVDHAINCLYAMWFSNIEAEKNGEEVCLNFIFRSQEFILGRNE